MKQILFVILIILGLKTTAQTGENSVYDSLNALKKVRPLITDFESLIQYQTTYDTLTPSIFQAQRHLEARREMVAYQNLGTHYSPLFNLGELYTPDAGFKSGNRIYAPFIQNHKNSVFYKTQMPYTSFRYAQGGQQYIALEALHSQQIIPTWNLTGGVKSFTAKGFGVQQLHEHRAPFVSSNFTTPNNKIKILTSLNWLKKAGAISGGIYKGDSFRQADGSLIDAESFFYLVDAGRDRNNFPTGLNNSFDTAKISNHMARFQFHIGNKKMDTLDSIYKVDPIFAFYYQIEREKEEWLYNGSEEDSTYFNSFGFDLRSTLRDSIYFRVIRNEVGFNKFQRVKNGFSLGGAFGIENITYSQSKAFRIKDVNTYVNAHFFSTVFNRIDLKAKGRFYLSGFNGGDYRINAHGSIRSEKNLLLATLESQAYTPGIQELYYSSRSFSYFNFFSKVINNKIALTLIGKSRQLPWHAQFFIQNINNYVIFDESQRPLQLNNAIQLVQVNFNKNFNYKVWNAHATGFVQQTNGSSKVSLPNIGLRLDLYLQKFIFDSAMLLKTGADIGFYSKHEALRYQPLLRQFYYGSNLTLGNYPMLDLYLSGKIKTAIIFVKGENLMSLLLNESSNPSFSTPLYMTQPLALRVGFLWDFYF